MQFSRCAAAAEAAASQTTVPAHAVPQCCCVRWHLTNRNEMNVSGSCSYVLLFLFYWALATGITARKQKRYKSGRSSKMNDRTSGSRFNRHPLQLYNTSTILNTGKYNLNLTQYMQVQPQTRTGIAAEISAPVTTVQLQIFHLKPMTHSPETNAINRLHSFSASF